MNNITSSIIKAMTNKAQQHTITAVFNSGREVTYTTAMIELLKTDKAINYIYDNETGEILFSK